MLDGIETLMVLDRLGTISSTAIFLRLTQSAVSKRIQALSDEMGFDLIEPIGRRVRLTQEGSEFLTKAIPLVAKLKDLKNIAKIARTEKAIELSVGLADSIASSWGPKLLKFVEREIQYLRFDIHVHRGTVIRDDVLSGRIDFGLIASNESSINPLSVFLVNEPMVLISLQTNGNEVDRIITIEKKSQTWKCISGQKMAKKEILHVESFGAAIQMAKAGYGTALVPLGIASTIQANGMDIKYPKPGIERPIRVIAQKQLLNGKQMQNIVKSFKNITKSDTLFSLSKDWSIL